MLTAQRCITPLRRGGRRAAEPYLAQGLTISPPPSDGGACWRGLGAGLGRGLPAGLAAGLATGAAPTSLTLTLGCDAVDHHRLCER